MTSATGKIDPKRIAGGQGFTLVEIILVFVLIGLFGGLVVVNTQAIFRLKNEPPIERVITDAVREARFQAAVNKEVAWLAYYKEKGIFHITVDSRDPSPALPPDAVFGSGFSFSSSVTTNEEEEEGDKPPPSRVKSYPVFFTEEQGPPKIEFYALPPGIGYDGDPDDEPEDLPLARVPFDPGGFSVPFIVMVDSQADGVQGSIQFDPFSNQVLKTEGFDE